MTCRGAAERRPAAESCELWLLDTDVIDQLVKRSGDVAVISDLAYWVRTKRDGSVKPCRRG